MKRLAKIYTAAAIALLFVSGAIASDPLSDGRIAIVDISDSLLDAQGLPRNDVLEHLRNSGVLGHKLIN